MNLQEIFPVLFEVCGDGILITNFKGEILKTNSSCDSMFGYEPGELIGQKVEVLVPGRLEGTHKAHRSNYYEKPVPRAMGGSRLLSACKKSGEEFPVEISLTPIHSDGEDFIVVMTNDISRRVEIEMARWRNENLLKAIIESAVDGVITITQRGIILSMNPAAAKLFGYSKHEVLGKNIHMLMPEPYHSAHDTYIGNYLETGQKKIIGIGREVVGRRKDGAEFPFYLSVSEVDYGEGKVFAGIIHDLTEQKRAEEALITYNAELEQRVHARTEALAHAIWNLEDEIKEKELVEKVLRDNKKQIEEALEKEKELNELKSRFVSMASHEFRTPLATILSSISLVSRYEKEEQQEKRNKHIKRVKSNVFHLTNILNDFLSLSKLEEGIIEFNGEWIEPGSWFKEIIEEFQQQVRIGQKITLTIDGSKNNLYVDPHLLRNVLANLISNAIKYSPENSPINIKLELLEQVVRIHVIDHGMGIPESEQHHLFERFFRANNATNIQGTGLGLSIVKRYLDLLEGKISFTSSAEKGTTFIVELPRKLEI
jgi:two-component system sensor kinase FixL